MVVVGTALIDAFTLAFDWLMSNLPTIVRKIRDAFKATDTTKKVADRALFLGAAGGASMLDNLVHHPAMALARAFGLKGKDTPSFMQKITQSMAKSDLGFFPNGANILGDFKSGFLGIGQNMIKRLRSGLENVDLTGLKLPELNLKAEEKPVTEPKLPDELNKFEADFKDLLDRIDKMSDGLGKGMTTNYSIEEGMSFNSARFAAASAESFRRLRDFQASQKAEKNPQLQEQITTNRHLTKLIELQRKSGIKLDVVGVGQ
jgi:hypothetical protein